jgi:hypothetical protein
MMRFDAVILRRMLLASVLTSGVFAACSKETKTDTESEPVAESAAEEATAAPESEPEKAAEPEAAADDKGAGGAAATASAAAAQSSSAEKSEKEAAKPPSAGGTPKPPPAKEEPKGYTGDKPCRSKDFKFSSVRNACNKGGVDQAKSLMKGMVKRAKDDGKSIKCSSCHDSTKTYTLKPNAVEDMRALQ